MRNSNRLAIIALGLFVALPGCSRYDPEVKVTVKPAPGDEATQAGGSNTGDAAAVAGFGNLMGTVTFQGEIPVPPVVVKMGDQAVKDAAVCSAETIPDEGLVVDPATKGLANVVIYLDKKPGKIKDELVAAPKDPAIFDQRGCRFLPHVVAVRVGQPLLVLSDDPIAHNTHTYPVRNDPFNQIIPPKDRTGVPCNYSKAESAPIEVKCDLHSWMRAYHFPIDHPYFAVTDKDGKFSIAGLPAGKQVFKVWQEKAPGGLLERKLEITIKADADTTHDLVFDRARFAALPAGGARKVLYSRLLQGGEIEVTQAGR